MELVVSLLTSVINIFLGLFTYFKNPNSSTNKLFAFLAFQLSVWSITNYLSLHQSTEVATLMWIRLDMLPGALMGPTIYLLVTTFPSTKLNASKLIIFFLIFLVLVTMGLTISPYMFTSVVFENGNITAIPGPAIVIFGLNFVGSLVLAFIVLIKRFLKSTGLEHAQLKFLLLGLIATFSLIATTQFFFVILLKTSFFIQFGPLYTIILVGSISYAIVKHKFLDINFLVARTVSYALMILLVVAGYITLIYTITLFIPELGVQIKQIIIFSVLGVVVFFTAGSIQRAVESLTDRIFFKGRYDAEELLANLTNIMAEELDIRKLSERLLSILNAQMRIVTSSFIVIDKDKKQIQVEQDHGVKHFSLTNDELEKLLFSGKILVFDELPEGDAKMILRKHDISIFTTLKTKESRVGFLLLGPKASGDIYSSSDVDVLEIFGGQVAIALQNSLAYLEIQQFSQTLEKKVEERTKELKESQERELTKANELLKLKDEFVFIATHDLRTPVTAIDGYISLIEEKKPKFSQDIESNFGEVKAASGRLKQLVNDLLQVARGESGTIKVEVAPIDIDVLIGNVVKEVQIMANDKKVKLITNFDPTAQKVLADEFKLPEIMENLMSNAIKFNRPDGSVTVTTKKMDKVLQVSVADTGHGIPKAEQAKVFQKFFKYRGDITRDVPGTGLGLFVVRMLVEKMGGNITFTSEEEKGTTFVFTLPLANSA